MCRAAATALAQWRCRLTVGGARVRVAYAVNGRGAMSIVYGHQGLDFYVIVKVGPDHCRRNGAAGAPCACGRLNWLRAAPSTHRRLWAFALGACSALNVGQGRR